jgi:Fic family protein
MIYPALKRAKIPHELNLSSPVLKWLMKIAEARPFLDEYLGTPQEVKLLRRAKIKAVTYSNQIEGNHLSEAEVGAVFQGKKVKGSAQELKEISNYRTALDYVEKLAEDKRKLKQSDFCDIQKLVTQGLLAEKQTGRYRTIPVSIINSATGEKIDDCPEPHLLRDLMDDLWRWLDNNVEVDPFLQAFGFHFIAVAIHPFADGNGRTVRLMQHLLLLRGGQKIARIVPSETAIMRERDRYYSTIRQAKSLESLHPFLEFLAECFAVASQEVVAEGKALLRDKASTQPKGRHEKILSYARKQKTFSIGDILTVIADVPRRTIERDLSELVKDKKLVAMGEKKARVYRIFRKRSS